MVPDTVLALALVMSSMRARPSMTLARSLYPHTLRCFKLNWWPFFSPCTMFFVRSDRFARDTSRSSATPDLLLPPSIPVAPHVARSEIPLMPSIPSLTSATQFASSGCFLTLASRATNGLIPWPRWVHRSTPLSLPTYLCVPCHTRVGWSPTPSVKPWPATGKTMRVAA